MPVTRTFWLIAALLAAGCGNAEESGRLSQYAMNDRSIVQWKLPGKLREISGLALAPDGRLFAATDEHAVVYEIDYAAGAVVKTFAMQNPPIRGDFEGIAWLDGLLYLITSDGILYAAPEGADGEHVDASRVDTGLGEQCEIEGLAEDSPRKHLFFVCKGLVQGSDLSGPQIFEWSVAEERLVRSIGIPFEAITKALGVNQFNPSGIVVDHDTGNFVIVAARQRSLVELDRDGRLLGPRRFRQPSRHKQPEGIELTADGRLLIADEGGDKKARLAVYEPRDSGGSR